MSKIITDEQELNTAVGDLVTEDYALEILGLQSIADFRKFSRSFMKLSKIVKRIENSDNDKSEKGHSHDDRYYTEAEVNNELAKKLNKGAVSLEYDTAKKIEDKIKEIDKKFNDELNKKLDKSTVTSEYDNAAKIESKIKETKKTADGKVSKSGDTMSGGLIVKDSQNPFTALYTRDMLVGGFARGYKVSIDGKSVAEFGVRGDDRVEKYVYIGTSWENARLLLRNNGDSQLKANNLETASKEVVAAINELNNNKLNKGAVSSDYDTAKKIEDKIKGITEKFKNFCPIRVGDILFTSLTTNPATSYLGTTWELLPNDLFIKTGNTPLQQAGSNSIKLSKANLPAEKLQVDSFSLGKGTQEITGDIQGLAHGAITGAGASGAFSQYSSEGVGNAVGGGSLNGFSFKASRTWSGVSTPASPYTENLGEGTPLTINPTHITLKAWKRLS